MIGIYKITNKINNQAYIGLSKHIEKRFKSIELDIMFMDMNMIKHYIELLESMVLKILIFRF